MNDTITTVEGLRVGHAQDDAAGTGCTVVLLEPEAPVACEARGGWPGTYDTHSIDVTKTFVKKHAIFLTGGDVFGFDTAIGIRRYLLERGLASSAGAGKLPGIVGANIYDIEFAKVQSADYPQLGHAACLNASTAPVEEGNFGAGVGATVGKLVGMKFASKGGCGSFAINLADGISVGALVVTNALGNIYDPKDGQTIAGVQRLGGGFREFEEVMEEYIRGAGPHNTTIGVVATNADLSHEQLIKVAQMVHDGLAMSIRPTHMSTDGDTLFAVTISKIRVPKGERVVDLVGYEGAKCVATAVVRSVRAASTLHNIPGLNRAK